jgi:hypothetical protein
MASSESAPVACGRALLEQLVESTDVPDKSAGETGSGACGVAK